MHFERILADIQHLDGEYVLPETWAQGRTIYGGLVAAIIVKRLKTLVTPERQLRSAQITFSGPIFADTPFYINTEVLREGKSVSQVVGRLIQGDVVCAQVVAVYTCGINSSLAINNFNAPNYDEPGPVGSAPVHLVDPSPKFMEHFDLQLREGNSVFTGSKLSTHGGWLKFRDEIKAVGEEHLLALIDTWPPASAMALDFITMVSSVNWSVHFVNELPEMSSTEYLGYRTELKYTERGIGYSNSTLWNKQKELVAFSSQTIMVFG